MMVNGLTGINTVLECWQPLNETLIMVNGARKSFMDTVFLFGPTDDYIVVFINKESAMERGP